MKKAVPIFPHKLVFFAFVLLTLLPALGHLFSNQSKLSESENRYLAEAPSEFSGLTEFTEKLDGYLNDNFGFRKLAVKIDRKIRALLGDEDLVYEGRDGWLFLSEALIWDSYLGRSGFSDKDLNQSVKFLTDLHAKANANNAAFVATIVPNKASIYSEYVPVKFGEKSSRNLHDYLMRRPDVEGINLVNIKPALLGLKSSQQVYYKTDTHWTMRGAFEAYQVLAESLKSQDSSFSMISEQDLKPINKEGFSGDLSKINYAVSQENLTDVEVNYNSGHTRQIIKDDSLPNDRQTTIYERENAQPKTVVIVGDSFSVYLLEFLKRDFDKIVFIHHKFGKFTNPEIYLHEPDAVIFSTVERYAAFMGKR